MFILKKKLYILDTTLRDGAQSARINFTLKDKIEIIKILDDLGLDFCEAGAPGISEIDNSLFDYLKLNPGLLKNIKPVAFSLTCREGTAPENDEILLNAVTRAIEYIALVGKSDIIRIEKILKTSKDENLRMINDSIRFAVNHGRRVIFEAEHFFEGYHNDPAYSLDVIKTAASAGAERIVLCDTNGSILPDIIPSAIKNVKKICKLPVGIHCHNDSGLAVANTMTAVKNGAVDIHGTICGIGERCGNADLCTVIPNLQLKMGYNIISREKLKKLAYSARKISATANIVFDEYSPYIGKYAFAHKAGMHIDGEIKQLNSFQHINPEDVGNKSVFLMSNQSGKNAIIQRINELGITVEDSKKASKAVLERIKKAELNGYQYENADASLNILIYDVLGIRKSFFELMDFKIVLGDPSNPGNLTSALIKIKAFGKTTLVAEEGLGPVNAIDRALRRALAEFYPAVNNMKLSDYKVRVIDSKAATAANVVVSIESSDENISWRTIGVSTDIIKASWIALCESVEYKLIIDDK